MNKKETMYKRIAEHGQNLNNIFHTNKDNITLCKKLRGLESKAHYLTLQYCNGKINNDYNYDVALQVILDEVNQLLCNIQKTHVPIFINQDPRGYALKIKSAYVRDNNLKIYRDFGGYGIIAPDLK